MSQTKPFSISPKELNNWFHEKRPHPLLIDVREEEELAVAPFPIKVMHLPLSRFEEWIDTWDKAILPNQPLVVICHRGVRSLNFCNWLLEKNYGPEVWNLTGGIDAWSLEVDPKITRY